MIRQQSPTQAGSRHGSGVPLSTIVGLGVTQIIGYGTIYYAFAILAPALAVEFATSPVVLFAILSVGLFGAGLASPRLGSLMDRHGAPRIMAMGSATVAVLMAALALAPDLITYAVLIFLLQVVSVAVLYTAAFATLAQSGGTTARRAITHLTLIAGFASTLFWPLTGFLVDAVGYRACYGLFAGLHLAVALPVHLGLARRLAPGQVATGSKGAGPAIAAAVQFAPLMAIWRAMPLLPLPSALR